MRWSESILRGMETTETRTTSIAYRVQCGDGITHHEHDFVTYAGAKHWAHWEHACTTSHKYYEVETVETLTLMYVGVKV